MKEKCGGVELLNEEVYMGPTMGEFLRTVILKLRGGSGSAELNFDRVSTELELPYFQK